VIKKETMDDEQSQPEETEIRQNLKATTKHVWYYTKCRVKNTFYFKNQSKDLFIEDD